MTGLDTTVLVRYLTEDDPIQSRRAADFIPTVTTRARDDVLATLDQIR